MTDTERRLQLRQAGYLPIPVNGKAPVLNGWQHKIDTSEAEITQWSTTFPNAGNTGLLTRTMPTIDIDILNAEASEAVEVLVRKHFEERGCILVRIGKAPKRAVPLRTDVPFNKITANILAPDGTSQKLELLADGQQVVAFGPHKDTGNPYRWHGGEPGKVKREELPEVNEADVRQFFADAVKLLCEGFGYTVTKEKVSNGNDSTSEDWGSLLSNIITGHALHDSIRDLAAKLVAAGTNPGTAVNILRATMGVSPAAHDARWQQRFDDIPRMVKSAREKFGSRISAEGPDMAPAFSEEALALRFAKRHAGDERFVAMFNKWLRFDGTRWRSDETREAFSLARSLCREAAGEVNNPKAAKAIATASTRAAVISLAREDRRLAATVDQWDADPWLLNTPGGVIDLRSSVRREHRADDYMTKITAVTPDASCPTPLWSKFIAKVTREDKEYQAFLARMSGYALTGVTIEHALFFLHGDGGNGKGVFMGTTADIMGDYHRTAPIETFTATNTEQHPTDLAMLRGARMVSATETEEGRRWAESRIKTLTGGDRVSARFMRQDFFEYVPQFKLTIAGNHKPGLRSVDEAIRRRLHLLPFTVTIPEAERDPELRAKLEVEWPGILAWMIEGCMEWQRIGLKPPMAVTEATDAYLEAEDAIKLWLDECCTLDAQRWTSTTSLFESWREWAEGHGEYAGSAKRFKQRLETLGYEPKRNGAGQRGFSGLSLQVR